MTEALSSYDTYDPRYKVGNSFRRLPIQHPASQLHHVRGFVDGVMVVCHWSKRWQCWKYAAVSTVEAHVHLSSVKFKKTPSGMSFEQD